MLTLIFGHPRTGRATNKRKRSWRCLDTLSIMLTLFGCQDVPFRRRGTRVAQAGRTESSDVVWPVLVPTLHSLQAASLRSIAEETGIHLAPPAFRRPGYLAEGRPKHAHQLKHEANGPTQGRAEKFRCPPPTRIVAPQSPPRSGVRQGFASLQSRWLAHADDIRHQELQSIL